MKVKDGDVLKCSCPDCGMEVTVTQTCKTDTCSTKKCDELQVMCCGEPMKKK